jgi:hypothetical protein
VESRTTTTGFALGFPHAAWRTASRTRGRKDVRRRGLKRSGADRRPFVVATIVSILVVIVLLVIVLSLFGR